MPETTRSGPAEARSLELHLCVAGTHKLGLRALWAQSQAWRPGEGRVAVGQVQGETHLMSGGPPREDPVPPDRCPTQMGPKARLGGAECACKSTGQARTQDWAG